MSTETEANVNYLSDLVVANPADSDYLNVLGSQVRCIKKALSGSFPGATAHAFPVFPVGTVIGFFQSAVPTGWSLVTTWDDYVVKISSSAGGATGGNAGHTISTGCTVVATHSHGLGGSVQYTRASAGSGLVGAGGDVSVTRSFSTSTDNASVNLSVQSNSGTVWQPRYLTVILGAKL